MKYIEVIKKHTILFSLLIGFAIFLYGYFFHKCIQDYSGYFILISLVSPFCAVFFSRRKLFGNFLIGIAITFLIVVCMSIFWLYIAPLLVKPSFSFENEAPLIQVIFYGIASTLVGLLFKMISKNKKITHLKIVLTILLVVWVSLYVKESLQDKVLYLCPTLICSTYKTSLPRVGQINTATPSLKPTPSVTNKQVSNISSAIPLHSVTECTNSTTTWITCVNSSYKYSVKIPPNWQFFRQTDNDSIISIKPIGTEEIPITINSQTNQKGLSADEVVDNQMGQGYSREERVINGVVWKVFENTISPYKSVNYLTIKTDTIYQVGGSILKEEYITVLDQILSTFKFIDTSSDTDVKTYSSQKLDISFDYIANQSVTVFSVLETDNTIYLYPQNAKPEDGQWVQVFSKNPTESLSQTIQRLFGNNNFPESCRIETISNPNPKNLAQSNYQFARIGYNGQPPESIEWAEDAQQKCGQYVTTNGVSYFMSDPNHSTKFVYFSIGQYAILANNDQFNPITWQETLRFIN